MKAILIASICGFLLVLLGVGLGLGIAFSIRPTHVRDKEPVAKGKGKEPEKPAPKTGPAKGEVKKPAGIDRERLIGKWEYATNKDDDKNTPFWEFKADGTGSNKTLFTLFGSGEFHWNIQGDVCNLDQGGSRVPYRVTFEEGDKLVLIPTIRQEESPVIVKNHVLKRLTKSREDFLEDARRKADEERKKDAAIPFPF